MEPIISGSKIRINSNRPNLANTSNAPYLEVEFAGGPGSAFPYNFIWNDKGSDAAYSVSIYRPQDIPESYYLIGDYAQNNYDAVTNSVMIVTPVNDDPNDPILIAPQTYNMKWSTQGTDSDAEGSIWEPVPPVGYVAMGWVAQTGYTSAPSISNFMCVRADFVQIVNYTPQFIWDDRRSGADQSIALYTPGNNEAGFTFVGQSNYDDFNGTIYMFNNRIQ